MEEKYYEIIKMENEIYRIHEPETIYTTVIVGKKKALVIDTGHGFGNLKEAIDEITNLPLIVFNTHGHMDHTGGNSQFNEVYINFKELELYYEHQKEKRLMVDRFKERFDEARKPYLWPKDFDKEEYLKGTTKKFLPIKDGEKIDLGDRIIEFIEVPGHTEGQTIAFDHNSGLAISGDAVSYSLWLYYETGYTLEEDSAFLDKLKNYPIKGYLPTHIQQVFPPEIIDALQYAIKHRDKEKSKLFIHPRNGGRAYIYRQKVSEIPGVKNLDDIKYIYILFPLHEKGTLGRKVF